MTPSLWLAQMATIFSIGAVVMTALEVRYRGDPCAPHAYGRTFVALFGAAAVVFWVASLRVTP